VGGWEKFQKPKKKKKKKLEGGQGENKVPKKIDIRVDKAREKAKKKVNLGWHKDRKENPINAPSIHVGALEGAGSFWPFLPL
jgi:hypothetical protein